MQEHLTHRLIELPNGPIAYAEPRNTTLRRVGGSFDDIAEVETSFSNVGQGILCFDPRQKSSRVAHPPSLSLLGKALSNHLFAKLPIPSEVSLHGAVSGRIVPNQSSLL